MSLRTGLTTGTCAAAAAKAATMVLGGAAAPAAVELRLPGGQTVCVPILFARPTGDDAVTASVRKDAGDDPDVTDGVEVRATVARQAAGGLTLVAGRGVGTVTKPGLQIPPGQPAINPVPRQMIAAAVREVTADGLRVEISIPGGRQLARKTFNPRLGIQGGLSILGTSGIVRPYCDKALHDALRCALDVAAACGVNAPVFVPGNIGAKSARRHFALGREQVIEAGNAWGFLLDQVAHFSPVPPARSASEGQTDTESLAGASGWCDPFRAILLLGHPGKLAKLAAGHWDTHSAHSAPATEVLARLAADVLGHPVPEVATVEGLLAALEAGERRTLSDALAGQIRLAVARRVANRFSVAVFLVNMAGECLGADGDLSPWR